MKRFVTYLYECERGNKSKNVGFIRVNVRGEEVRMEVFLRNLLRGKDVGKLYALVYEHELMGIELAELTIRNGQGDSQLSFRADNIVNSGFSLNDIVGIGIYFDSGAYIASCWKDAHVDGVTRGEFAAGREEMQGEERKMQLVVAEEESKRPVEVENSDMVMKQVAEREMGMRSGDGGTTYEKIDLSQIRDLPSPNWHFTTNSFLVHGFWNYGYLVLKKEMEKGKEILSLGVPGIFEKPEAVMAVLFGFPEFEEIPKEMAQEKMNQPREFEAKEKNQEAMVGTFGCWFVNLKL